MLKPFTKEGRFESGLDDIVKGKVWAYLPVCGDLGGWGLGIAIANERGYHPVPWAWCHADTRDEMQEHVNALNNDLGIGPKVALDIAVSSMRKDMPPFVPGLAASERFILHWLSREDASSYGECKGKDLDWLIRLGLAEKGAPPLGGTDDFAAVSLTGLGWRRISELRAEAAEHALRAIEFERAAVAHCDSLDNPEYVRLMKLSAAEEGLAKQYVEETKR
jgi:hypothetical protein